MNKEIIAGGKKIFYRVYGNGKPVMLVHGFGETGDVWDNQVGFLKKKFKLIVPDLPGSGQSDMITDMSMEGMAEILKKIIEKENINSFSLVGHSMGGYITLAFVKKYPQFLERFSLFHSSAYADSEEKKATRKKGIDFVKKNGAFEFFKNTTPNLFSSVTRSENQQLIDDFIQSLNNFSAESLVSYYKSMMKRPDTTSVLKNAAVPVQFIMGKEDNAVPLQDGLELCHLPEKSYIDILEKSGHMGMIEEPEISNKALEKFLA